MADFRKYYQLIKPGIVWSNTLSAVAGYLFGSAWEIEWSVFVAMAVGTALVIACACVLNNYIDRGIDAKMLRTSQRALVTGAVKAWQAGLYAAILGVLGFAILGLWTSGLVLLLGAIALFAYVVLYGWAKRLTVHGTLIGTIPGSLPLATGYVAATGRFDVAALLLFLALAAWQMAHFYSIAMYRAADYKAAGLPMLPLVKGMQRAKVEIVVYVLLFAMFTTLLSVNGYAGTVFLLVILPLAGRWLWGAFGDTGTNAVWGRRMFGTSLIVLLTFFAALSVGAVLP